MKTSRKSGCGTRINAERRTISITDMEWGDAVNYDLSLNSGTLGIETCVSVIEELYQKERKENE